MTQQDKLREKIAKVIRDFDRNQNFFSDELTDQILTCIKEAGYKSPSIKICNGCPDRFEGCVQLDPDRSLPLLESICEPLVIKGFNAATEVMLKAGWRKIKK